MSTYKKYCSIKSPKYFKKYLSLEDNEEWVGLEKINGANIIVKVDKTGKIVIVKRNSYAKEYVDDLIYINAIKEIENKIASLCDIIKNEFILFGELFGGIYPGYKSDLLKISKEIYYTPNHEVMFYDLLVDGIFYSYDSFIEIMCSVGLKAPPLLVRGSRQDVLNFNIKIPSSVPAFYDLPIIFDCPNIIEGIVVKPVYHRNFPCGKRMIMKIKNKELQ